MNVNVCRCSGRRNPQSRNPESLNIRCFESRSVGPICICDASMLFPPDIPLLRSRTRHCHHIAAFAAITSACPLYNVHIQEVKGWEDNLYLPVQDCLPDAELCFDNVAGADVPPLPLSRILESGRGMAVSGFSTIRWTSCAFGAMRRGVRTPVNPMSWQRRGFQPLRNTTEMMSRA